MIRNIVSVVSILILFGCATVGPATQRQGPDLQNEYELAKAAVEEARQWEAPKYRPDQFQAAVDRLEEVRRNQDRMVPEKAVAEYRQVQILANKATIDSLLDQMDEQDARIARLEETKKRQLARIEKLRDRVQSIENRSQKKQEELDRARVSSRKLQEKVNRMEEEQTQLEESRQELRNQVEQQQKQLQKQREEIRSVRSRLEERSKQVQELKTEREKIAEEFREKLDKATVRQDERGVVVNIQEKVLFDLGKAEVKPRARQTLGSVASVLQNYPDREIHVEGHTDTLPISTRRFPSNWELSAQRALNVLKFLTERHGLSRDRIAAVAYGEYRPLVPNTSPENRRRNRRVEIVLLPPDLPKQTQDAVEGEG